MPVARHAKQHGGVLRVAEPTRRAHSIERPRQCQWRWHARASDPTRSRCQEMSLRTRSSGLACATASGRLDLNLPLAEGLNFIGWRPRVGTSSWNCTRRLVYTWSDRGQRSSSFFNGNMGSVGTGRQRSFYNLTGTSRFEAARGVTIIKASIKGSGRGSWQVRASEQCGAQKHGDPPAQQPAAQGCGGAGANQYRRRSIIMNVMMTWGPMRAKLGPKPFQRDRTPSAATALRKQSADDA